VSLFIGDYKEAALPVDKISFYNLIQERKAPLAFAAVIY